MKWWILALMLLGSVVSCGEPPSATPSEIKKRGVLVVGTEAEFAPFEYVTPEGKIVGFDMDLAQAIADEIGVDLKIENLAFTSLIPSLQTGRIDLILSGMTATDERRQTIAFSEPYFLTGLCLLVNKEKAGDISDWKRFNDANRTVVVKTGTTSDFFVREKLPKANRVGLEKENDCAMEVATGRADVFIYDQLSIKRHHEQNLATTRAYLTPITHEPYSIGLRQDDAELLALVNDALAKLKESGRFKEFAKKHGLPLADGE